MFTEERQSAIEKCLRENGKVKVKELSEMFQVTEDCIRKDLKILENVGKLKRTYGGAILSQDYPLKRDVVDRRQFNLDKKRTIAAKAFKLIKNNETIFLDISTTNIELAKNLKGYLMLVTGDVDNNVHPANTLRMADALLKAGKNFDLVILPGQSHGFMGIQQAFYQRKMWFHFAKHLLGDYSSDQFREIDAYMRL